MITGLVEQIKTSSNAWIKDKGFSRFKFSRQRGYGGFSHSHSQIDSVVKYILNQDEHHKKESFKREYLDILKRNEIEFKDEYLFDFYEETNDWEG